MGYIPDPDPSFDSAGFVRDATFEPCEGGCGHLVAGPALFNNGSWGFAELDGTDPADYWSRSMASHHTPERCREEASARPALPPPPRERRGSR